MLLKGEIPHDVYKTIKSATNVELKERGSRFIAQAIPVNSKQAAEVTIEEICKTYFDATHNCFAYRVGWASKEYSRFNDDGEPSGTAGKPILQVILGRELTNVLIMVTRYFGGTKLGTGGLIRAYGGAAALALEHAELRNCYIADLIAVECSYDKQNVVSMAIEKFDASVVHSEFAENVRYRLAIRQDNVQPFIKFVVNQTAGQVRPQHVDAEK